PNNKILVRLTAPPAQPLDGAPSGPIYRGANPANDDHDRRPLATSGAFGRPTYLPDYPAAPPPPSPPPSPPVPAAAAPNGWSPVPPGAAVQPPTVQLGAPQFSK